jgi:hypothetical protein
VFTLQFWRVDNGNEEEGRQEEGCKEVGEEKDGQEEVGGLVNDKEAGARAGFFVCAWAAEGTQAAERADKSNCLSRRRSK